MATNTAERSGARRRRRAGPKSLVERCRQHFLAYFPEGFRDESYLSTERAYKRAACVSWQKRLAPDELRTLVRDKQYGEVAARAVAIEARTNLLFSFEKMALRDALKSSAGSRTFAQALLAYTETKPTRVAFESWVQSIASLPRRQTRVLTWPLLTVFGFLARPRSHIFLKPKVTQRAARAYGYDFDYSPRPNWQTYASLLGFAVQLRRDLSDMRPRDMIDLQSFIWVQGSEEYP